MPNVVGKQYTMERRTFLKLSAAAAAAGVVIDFEAAAVSGECKEVKDLTSESEAPLGLNANAAGKELLYWIDGPMNSGLPDYSTAEGLLTRARLSLTMVTRHNETDGWVESVSLTDDQNKIIAQNFYGSSVGTVTGNAPYTVFENLDLDTTKQYNVIYVKSDKLGNRTAFVHTIKNPEASRFDYNHFSYMTKKEREEHYLPDLAEELEGTNQYYFGNDATKSGYITTPYGQTQGGHHCVAHVVKIEGIDAKNSEGDNIQGDFKIKVKFMHRDLRETHYMRYFLVLDPVGRILGGVRRLHGDNFIGDEVEVQRGFHTPLKKDANSDRNVVAPSIGIKPVYEDDKGNQYGRLHGTILTGRQTADPREIDELSNEEIKRYITSMSILDCPFVTIYTDDKYHAIARCCLRLR